MKFPLSFDRFPSLPVSGCFLSGTLLLLIGSSPVMAQHTQPLPVSMPDGDVAACHALALPGPPCSRAEAYRQQREHLFHSPVSTDLTEQILRARQIHCLDLLLGEAERECAAEAVPTGPATPTPSHGAGHGDGHEPVPGTGIPGIRNTGDFPPSTYHTPNPADTPHSGPYRAVKPGMSDLDSDTPHPGPYRAVKPWMSAQEPYRAFRQSAPFAASTPSFSPPCDRLSVMLQAARQRAGRNARHLRQLLDIEERFQRLCGDSPSSGTVMMAAPAPVPHLPPPPGFTYPGSMIPHLEPHGPHLPPRPPETPDQ